MFVKDYFPFHIGRLYHVPLTYIDVWGLGSTAQPKLGSPIQQLTKLPMLEFLVLSSIGATLRYLPGTYLFKEGVQFRKISIYLFLQNIMHQIYVFFSLIYIRVFGWLVHYLSLPHIMLQVHIPPSHLNWQHPPNNSGARQQSGDPDVAPSHSHWSLRILPGKESFRRKNVIPIILN